MVIGEEPGLIGLLHNLLPGDDMAIAKATGPEEGLLQLKDHPFDLVFLGFGVEADGFCTRVKADPVTEHIFIVMLLPITEAAASDSDPFKGGEVDGYLPYPVPEAVFSRCLHGFFNTMKKEQRCRRLYENIQDVIYRVDRMGRILEITPAITRYSGYLPSELIGQPVEQVYQNPEDRNTMMARLMEKGEVSDFNILLKTRDGEPRWAALNANVIFDDAGNFNGVEGSIRDVTERYIGQQRLRESEEKFRTLAMAAPFAIMIYQDDYWVYTNPAGEEISGYSASELYAMKFWEFVDPEFREQVKSIGRKRQTARIEHSSYEFKIVTKTGESLWVFLAGNSVTYQGKMSGIISVIDITRMKRDEMIRQVLYDISGAAFLEVDLEGLIGIIRDKLGKLIDTTNFFIAFYDENTGMLHAPYWKDKHDDISSWNADGSVTGIIIRENRSLLLKKQDILELNRQKIVSSGKPRSECWLGVPLHENNKVIGAFVLQSYDDPDAFTFKDLEMMEFVSDQIGISLQRKKAELELVEAMDKAKESEQLKSAFLANMSHEIRTPMNAILGFTDLLKESPLPTEEQNQYLDIISNSGNRLMHIIDDIIDLSKLDANQVRIVQQPCDVQQLIISTVEAFHEMDFYKKKPALELVYDKSMISPLQEIETDPVRLRQILDNLITNAIKFTDRGSVEVGVRVVEKEEHPFLEFFVKDTGKGIPTEKCAMIFERFRQVEEHEYHEGSGLGLSISKALVGLLGGEMAVDSEVGMGSTFLFTIPYNPAQRNLKSDLPFHPSESMDLRGMTIFVAEDDPDSWFFLKVLFRDTNATLKRAAAGDVLMNMLREELPDLILLDINMPGKTGYECMKEIRSLGHRVKVIAQTAYAMADERQRCLDVGCDGYLAKPFSKEKLFTVIAAVFRTN